MPLVADFGVSRGGISATMAGTAVGTPGYMAPEVHLGQITTRSDVYSFGVATLVLATGRPSVRMEGSSIGQRWVALATEAAEDAKAGRAATEQAAAGGATWQPVETLEGLLRLARACTLEDRMARPSMAEVALALAELLAPGGGPSEYFTQPAMLTATAGQALACTLCEARPRAVVFEPCCHAVACAECAEELRAHAASAGQAAPACPVCRAPVSRVVVAPGPVTRTWQGEGRPPPPPPMPAVTPT